MITKQLGNTTIHFEPLIIVIVVAMVVYLIIALSVIYRGKKVNNAFQSGDYDEVLINGEKLLKTYQGYAKRYKHRNTLSWIESLHFMLAVSYFSVENYEQFLYHINAMSQNCDIKEFWLSLYYLRQGDFDSFNSHYANIKVSGETLLNRTYLESIKLYMQGEYDLAKTNIIGVYKGLKHPILIQIADEVMKT